MSALVTTGSADVRAILGSLTRSTRSQARDVSGNYPTESLRAEERPDVLLARMLGLDGAVAVGDQLERNGSLQAGEQNEQTAALHRQIMMTMVKRRSAIRLRVERRYAQAFEGVRPVPGAQAILDLLAAQGARTDPRARHIAAKKIAERYQVLLGSTLGVVRKELYWLRQDTLLALDSAGDTARRWIALDAALDGALEQATTKAQRTLEVQVIASFAERLERAITCLPNDAAVSSIELWFQRSGVVGGFIHDSRRLCWALLDTDWNRLRALVEACCGPWLSTGHSIWPSVPPDSHETEAG